MNYGRKTPSTYRSNHSVYSHTTGRSSTNLHSIKSRSMRSVRVPWYQRPILKNNQYIDIQKNSMLIGIFSIFLALFTIGTSIFDIYCLAMAAPGSTHYGYYIISYEFVYVGNKHVRNMLIVFALFSLILGIIILFTSILLVIALRKYFPYFHLHTHYLIFSNDFFLISLHLLTFILFHKLLKKGKKRKHFVFIPEYERKILPWLNTFAVFTVWRSLALIFFAIVNDLIFAYNVIMVLLWSIALVICIYGWCVVYSLFLELTNLTKLEDLAHLRMGTMASLHASAANSLAGSRPTTPHSTVSTMPVG